MNLIIVCIDTLRRDYMGCFGNPRIRTPNFDRFFEKAVIFDRFRINAIPTIPFRRGFMLGREVFPYKDAIKFGWSPLGWQPLGQGEVTLQEALKEAGYVTAMVTDVWHYYRPGMNFHKGFDSWQFIRGQEGDWLVTRPSRQNPEEVMDPKLSGKLTQQFLVQHLRNVDTRRSEEDYFAPRVFRTAEKWLQKNAKYFEKFFLYIDCFDPHEPWDPPREYVELYDPGYKGKEYIFTQNGPCDHLSEEEIKHVAALYAGEVTMVDRWFGHFMEKYELMGLQEDTAVLFLSDHGICLGDHGIMKKMTNALYTELLDVPFMLVLPGTEMRKKRIKGFIQEFDIAPTLLNLLGLEKPSSMTGVDFWPLITGEKELIREHVVGGYHTCAYLQDERYHYIRNLMADGDVKLFDLQEDPSMNQNIIGDQPEQARTMEEKLLKKLDGWTPPKELLGKRVYDMPYSPLKGKRDGW
jgi:arylsulfatase A-like enzyme